MQFYCWRLLAGCRYCCQVTLFLFFKVISQSIQPIASCFKVQENVFVWKIFINSSAECIENTNLESSSNNVEQFNIMSFYLMTIFTLWPLTSLLFLCQLSQLRIVTVGVDSWLWLQVNVHLVVCWVLTINEEAGMVGGNTGGTIRDHQTPGFICKLQKTIEVSGAQEEEENISEPLSPTESGHGEDAWSVSWGLEGSVLQCEGLGESHQLFLHWYHQADR